MKHDAPRLTCPPSAVSSSPQRRYILSGSSLSSRHSLTQTRIRSARAMKEAAAPSTAAASHQLSLPGTAGFMVAGVILVFVLFILLLLLYLRSNRYWGAIPSSSNPLARPAPGLEPCGGLDPAALPPEVLLRAGYLKEGLECSVCLCELAEGDAVRLLPACGHAFHLECIDPWLCAHSACPLCRAPVAHKSPEIQDSAVELSPVDSNSPEGSSSSSIELTIEVRAGDVLSEEATPTTARSWLRVLGRGSRVAGEFDLEQGRAPIPKAPTSS